MLEDNRREGKQPIDIEEGESEKEESKEEKGEEQKGKEEEPMLVPREYIPRAPFPQRSQTKLPTFCVEGSLDASKVTSYIMQRTVCYKGRKKK